MNNNLQQPGQFGPPPRPQPEGLEARFHKAPAWVRWGLISLSGLIFISTAIFLMILVGTSFAPDQSPVAAGPTVLAEQQVPTPSPMPTVTPTATPAVSISATHGRPQLGGPVSDFYGKYGQPYGDNQPGSTGWSLDSSNVSSLVVHYDVSSHIVNYIAYSGPSDWSKEQYKNFLLTFAPDGTTEDTQTNAWWKSQGGDVYDPIAYTSPTIKKFFLHISDGSGYSNTV